MSEKFSARECALIAAKAADEHKATDIMVLEVGQLVDVTEYFVIATARNTPPVSYTHLDVYKRQGKTMKRLRSCSIVSSALALMRHLRRRARVTGMRFASLDMTSSSNRRACMKTPIVGWIYR